MYGVFCYGVDDSVVYKREREILECSDQLDMNDFLHCNSPYSSYYVQPALMGHVEQSAPTSSEGQGVFDDLTLDSGHSSVEGDSAGHGRQVIDQYGTNRTAEFCEQERSVGAEDNMDVNDDIVRNCNQSLAAEDEGLESIPDTLTIFSQTVDVPLTVSVEPVPKSQCLDLPCKISSSNCAHKWLVTLHLRHQISTLQISGTRIILDPRITEWRSVS